MYRPEKLSRFPLYASIRLASKGFRHFQEINQFGQN